MMDGVAEELYGWRCAFCGEVIYDMDVMIDHLKKLHTEDIQLLAVLNVIPLFTEGKWTTAPRGDFP
jgi:hypothetical protein